MAVYTSISKAQLLYFLRQYDVGEMVGFRGIENGTENSNYLVRTTLGHYILTLFEALDDRRIRDIFSLLKHMHQCGLSVPVPLPNKQRVSLNTLNDKLAALFCRLPGDSIMQPAARHCFEVGRKLAKLHLYGSHFSRPNENLQVLNDSRIVFERCKSRLKQQEIKEISDELSYQQQFDCCGLPTGVIHGDLFRDNVLFAADRVSGLLDFYASCNDYLLLDVAITLNDWCQQGTSLCPFKLTSLLNGYQSVRPLERAEARLLSVFLRRAALRFWLSRLNHRFNAERGAKDPEEYRYLLNRYRRQQISALAMQTPIQAIY